MNWLRRLFVGTIPRDIHDQIVSDLRAQLAEYRHDNRRMLRTITKMKVAGGSIPRAITGARLEPRQPDPMQRAIEDALDANARTKRPGPMRNRHRSWAESEIAKDPSNEQHVRSVLDRVRAYGIITADDDDDDDTIAVSA